MTPFLSTPKRKQREKTIQHPQWESAKQSVFCVHNRPTETRETCFSSSAAFFFPGSFLTPVCVNRFWLFFFPSWDFGFFALVWLVTRKRSPASFLRTAAVDLLHFYDWMDGWRVGNKTIWENQWFWRFLGTFNGGRAWEPWETLLSFVLFFLNRVRYY